MKKEASGIVINTNIDDFQRYKLERSRLVKQKSLEDRVTKLESDISEIKQLLQALQSRTN